MMAPHYERARMLCTAIECAVHELGQPIDRIEVTSRNVVVWAGSQSLAMSYHYANSYAPDGAAMPGSGEWVVESAGSSRITKGSWIGRLLSSVRKIRYWEAVTVRDLIGAGFGEHVDDRDTSAFTRVFDALCPAMTNGLTTPSSQTGARHCRPRSRSSRRR